MTKDLNWLKERQTGIGGSEAAAIIGANPYMTPLDVWEAKVHPVTQKPVNAAMKRGTVLEPVAAELYVQETGRNIRRQPMMRHPKFEWMIGNVDRQILAGTAGVTATGILEIKCPGIRVMAQIKAKGLPDYYVCQLHHYLTVFGYEWGSFALFNAENWELLYFDMERDQDFIDLLIEREQEFWEKYVLTGTPPPSSDNKPKIEVPEVEGTVTTVDTDEWRKAAADLREARELKSSAEELETAAKETFKGLMHRDELHAAEVPGVLRAYYKPQPGTTQWKATAEAVAREAGLPVENFVVKGNPSTRFTIYLIGETSNG
jgi:putative phage-type endonuclease